jgi:hypothetical protein
MSVKRGHQGHGTKQSRKWEQAIGALLTCGTIGEAAASVGVASSTLRRWLGHPEFASEYRSARRESMQAVTARLQHAAARAVAALEELLQDSDAQAMARVIAAKTILDHAYRAIEVEDFESRIEELEARMKGASSCR